VPNIAQDALHSVRHCASSIAATDPLHAYPGPGLYIESNEYLRVVLRLVGEEHVVSGEVHAWEEERRSEWCQDETRGTKPTQKR